MCTLFAFRTIIIRITKKKHLLYSVLLPIEEEQKKDVYISEATTTITFVIPASNMATFSNENNNDGIPNDISSPSKRLKYLYTTAFDCAEKSNQLKKHKYYQTCELLKESVQIFLEISELEKDGRKIELLKSKQLNLCKILQI